MDKCNKCSQEITANIYTLDKNEKDDWLQPVGVIELCENCFKNNKAHYLKEYKNIHGIDIKRVAKPVMDDGQESNFFECQKCQSIFNLENSSNSDFDNGCTNCQGKDFELKISLWNGILHYKIKECSKCHKMDMVDLLSWPESDNTKGKSKQEIIKIIKQENLNNQDNCQCLSNNPNPNNNGERERESKIRPTLINPPIIYLIF